MRADLERAAPWLRPPLRGFRPSDALKMQKGPPLYEQVHELLWEMLVKGEIAPLDHLSDFDWAKKLGTSRTPVREALRKMEHDGILRLLPRGGYEVRLLTPSDAQGLLKCCAALESMAAEVLGADEGGSIDALMAISSATLDLHRAGRLIEAIDAGRRFNEAIVQASQVPYLVVLHAPVRRLLLICEGAALRRLPATEPDLQRRCKGMALAQREILAAITRRDARRAAQLQGQMVRDDGRWWSVRMDRPDA